MSTDANCSSNQLEHSLKRAAKFAVMFLVLTLPLPAMSGAGLRYLLVPAGLSVLVLALASFESRGTRPAFVQLAVLGFAWSWLILLALAFVQRSANAVVLGPDGLLFLEGANRILAYRFSLPVPSYIEFETFATGHLYLFAGLIKVFGPGLFSLQAANCAMTALLGPLTFSWVRTAWPKAAIPAALLVTLYPSIIYLSAVDLWKDPSIITATGVVIWALAHISREDRWIRSGVLAVLGGGCLAYLHISRFYVAGYLELGMVIGAAAALLQRQRVNVIAVTAGLALLTIGEVGPLAFGWASTPQLFRNGVVTVQRAPSLSKFTAGFLDRAATDRQRHGRETESKTGHVSDLPVRLFPSELVNTESAARSKADRAQTLVQVQIDTRYAARPTFGSVAWFVQLARRIWGPFVWILPPTFSVNAWLQGDYLLYPGMLFWYVLLPAMVTGLLVAAWGILRGSQPFMVTVVVIFTGCYALQFLSINLPYRQREALFPVLVFFVVMGCEWLYARRWAIWAYGAYWAGLIAIAVTHISMRVCLAR